MTTYTQADLEVVRSDAGDGGWSIHIRGETEYLTSGTAERIPETDEAYASWNRPNAEDLAWALRVANEEVIDAEILNERDEEITDGGEWSPELRVELDEDGRATIQVTVIHSSERNSTRFDVWHGRTRQWTNRLSQGSVGVVDLDALEALKLAIGPHLQVVHAAHEVDWDGRNHVGKLTTDEADDASQEIDLLVERCAFLRDDISVWDAWEWIYDSRTEIAQRHGITAETTRERIAEIATTLDAEARREDVILTDIETAIERLIEEVKEDAAANEEDNA